MKASLLCILLMILGFQEKAWPQKMKKQYKYWSVGWNMNAMNYVGEVDPGRGILSPGIKFTRQNLGVFIGKRLSPNLTFRCNFSHGIIGGSDAENASMSDRDIHRKIRNLSFRSSVFEVKADVVYDIFKNRGKPEKRVDYTPYFFTGISYYHHNPKAKAPESMGGEWVELRPLSLEGENYSLHQISIPAGIGFRYKLGQRWDLAFEIGWRFTFTDYLDGISDSYRDRESFGDNRLAIVMYDRSMEGLENDSELAVWVGENQGYYTAKGYTTVKGYGRSGDQRGDPRRKDWYLVTGFHFAYIILKQPACPKFRLDR